MPPLDVSSRVICKGMRLGPWRGMCPMHCVVPPPQPSTRACVCVWTGTRASRKTVGGVYAATPSTCRARSLTLVGADSVTDILRLSSAFCRTGTRSPSMNCSRRKVRQFWPFSFRIFFVNCFLLVHIWHGTMMHPM